MGCHALLQGIFPTQGLNLRLLHLCYITLTPPALAGGFFISATWEAHKCGMLLLLLGCSSGVQLCATPEMAAHQAPPSLEFSRQEHWSGLPFPSPMQESEK